MLCCFAENRVNSASLSGLCSPGRHHSLHKGYFKHLIRSLRLDSIESAVPEMSKLHSGPCLLQ
jgi:hypothetical protein